MRYMFYSKEEKALQKKLIPLNIIVAIIALVAAVSLLITPLLTINVGQAMKAAADLMQSESSTGTTAIVADAGVDEGGPDNGSDDGSGDSGENGDSDSSKIFELMVDVLDTEISLKPLGMAKIAFAPADKKAELFYDDFFIQNGLIEKLSITVIDIGVVSELENVTGKTLENISFVRLNEMLMDLDKADSKESFMSKTDAYISEIEKQLLKTLSAEDKQGVKDTLGEMYDKAAADGRFSVEKMICVNLSPEGTQYSTYAELLNAMSEEGFEADGGMASFIAPVTQMVGMVAPYYGYGFYFVAAHALIWFILFLFAFIHIFKRNKRFTMWYVKLVSCWPCIIFGVILSFAGAKIAAMIPEMVAFAGLFGAFSTMTWISGGCYLLLWILSICWAFPIKRKIRKMRKRMK